MGSGLKLAVIGDSITEGFSYGGVRTYHAVIGERLRFDKVVNHGVGGAAYAKVPPYSSLNDILLQVMPDADVVLVFGGINDLLSPLGKPDDTDPSTVTGGINILFAGLRTKFALKSVGVVVPLGYNSGPERKDARLTAVTNAIESRAQTHQLPYFNLFRQPPFDPYQASDRLKFMPDGLHPNTEGHALIANVLEPFVRDLALAARKTRCRG